MQKPTWVKVLTTLASWLIIVAAIVLLAWTLSWHDNVKVVPTAQADQLAFNSPGKGDTPLAESVATNTIGYWLALASTTHNAYSFPSYLTGLPRTTIVPDLISCESSGNAHALNPKDRDGTPSYGLLQFKPSTLYVEAIQYGLLASSTPESQIKKVMYVAQLQVDVASYMIMGSWKKPAFWLQQFPQCFKDYRSDWGV